MHRIRAIPFLIDGIQGHLGYLSFVSPFYQLKEGESANARVLITFSNNDIVDVTSLAVYTSADSTVTVISSSGLLSELKPGATVIQAVYGGLTAQADVLYCQVIARLITGSTSALQRNLILGKLPSRLWM